MNFFTFFFFGPVENPFLAVSIEGATEEAALEGFRLIWDEATIYGIEAGIHAARPPKVTVEV